MGELPPPTELGWIDAVVIGLYLVLTLGLGVAVARRAKGTLEGFFLSGRNLPWWLAGTSMVATSFASDTPLVISGWTRSGGVSGNWRWWAYLVGTMLAAVVFARLWRRTEVLTDVEFMELRYSGRPARLLRGFKGVYQVIFMHCFVLGWVILAMGKVMEVMLGFGDEPVFVFGPFAPAGGDLVMLGCLVIALIYAELAGLWGVVLTDFIQFGVALIGAIVLMFAVVEPFGGFGGLQTALESSAATAGLLAGTPPLPDTGSAPWSRETWEFLVFVGVMWIASKNADGSGVQVQRMLASKDERHSTLASLWYAVAFFAVRPWPWILVALASLLVLPPLIATSPVSGEVVSVSGQVVAIATLEGESVNVLVPDAGLSDWQAQPRVAVGDAVTAGQVVAAPDDENAYPVMMRRYLPAGLLGLMIASFLAAFMSTVDTHLNLASAYLVNDVYKRFIREDADQRHYLRIARIVGIGVIGTGLAFAYSSDSLRDMFDSFSTLFGGVGLVYILRWFWWRINAWSEVAALLVSAAVTVTYHFEPALGAGLLPAGLVAEGEVVFAGRLLIVLGTSSLAVLVVTLLTPPVETEHLRQFVTRVRPLGAWGPVASPDPGRLSWTRQLLAWAASVVMVLGCLFLPASLLLSGGHGAWVWVLCALGGGAVLAIALPGLSRSKPPA